VSAGAIAAIMAELALRSARSGFSGHSVIHLIWSYNVIVVSSVSRVLWTRTIRTVPESLEVVETSEE
jgi:ribosomal protein L31E